MNRLMIIPIIVVCFGIGFFIGKMIDNEYGDKIISLENRLDLIETSLESCPTCNFKPEPKPTGEVCRCYSDISLRGSPFVSEDDPKIIALCEKQNSKYGCLGAIYNGKNASCTWGC